MNALLGAEVLKLRTTRTFAAFVAAALALSLLVAVLTAAIVEDPSKQDVRDFAYADASALFILLLAIVGTTGEWRHRTIASTILAAPDRARLVVAKVAAYAAAGVTLSAIVNVAGMAVATAILAGRGEVTLDAGELVDLLWRNLLVAAYLGALGVAVGILGRNQPAAIAGVLATLFIVEPAVFGLAGDVGRFGALIGAPSALLAVEDDPDLLSPGAGLAVMAAWSAIATVLAAASLRARDVT